MHPCSYLLVTFVTKTSTSLHSHLQSNVFSLYSRQHYLSNFGNLIGYNFFFVVLSLNSGPSPWATPPALFVKSFSGDRFLGTICPA
jgi:hypothetical protein